jgi:hypothetical protein
VHKGMICESRHTKNPGYYVSVSVPFLMALRALGGIG